MRSICFFASYFKGNKIPYYITVYLTELKKHFSEVVLLTSQNDLSIESIAFLKAENIRLQIEENEGFDFGLWYKAFQKNEIDTYDQIALVNDSCILFKPLNEFMEWSRSHASDLQGITLSNAIALHIQSYFLIINKRAIPFVKEYFEKHKLLKNISDVIAVYEVGLSSFLISKDLRIDAFMDNNGYNGEFSPYYYCVDYHISKGIPVIKKKILFASYRKDELFTLARMRFNISLSHYINLIKKNCKTIILDLEKLNTDQENSISIMAKIKYAINLNLIAVKRSLIKLVRG
jgi:rhamnosyltransferase